jgi:hypothetical protein
MHNWIRYIVLIAVWPFSVEANAQGGVETLKDTLISIVEVPADQTDTTRFDPIDQQEAIRSRSVSAYTLDSLRKDGDYWYANLAPPKKKAEEPENNKDSIFREKWFRNLLWIVILGSFIGVVIWYLVSSNILLFRKKAKSFVEGEAEEINTDDIFSIRYEPEIAKAENSGNYRFAIRLWYLFVLKDLSEKSLIEYQPGRTNHDYAMQLYKTSYGRDFSRLTRNFEYTWYGQFSVSADTYQTLRNDFLSFQKTLRR